MNDRTASVFEMPFDSTNPLTARQRFISRALLNIAVIAGLFILVVTLISLFIAIVLRGSAILMLVGDGAALVGAYGLYILWDKRPIKVRCEECEGIILSTTPWVCGVCKQENKNATEFPFVYKCGNPTCRAEPKAYRCHHCRELVLVFLTADQDETNYAYAINSPDETPEPDKHDEALDRLRKKREKKAQELDIAKIEDELASILKRIRGEKKKPKTALELVEEGVREKLEFEDAEALLVEKYKKMYKDNRAKLTRAKLAIRETVVRFRSEGK